LIPPWIASPVYKKKFQKIRKKRASGHAHFLSSSIGRKLFPPDLRTRALMGASLNVGRGMSYVQQCIEKSETAVQESRRQMADLAGERGLIELGSIIHPHDADFRDQRR
jgi:hypothetical protein